MDEGNTTAPVLNMDVMHIASASEQWVDQLEKMNFLSKTAARKAKSNIAKWHSANAYRQTPTTPTQG